MKLATCFIVLFMLLANLSCKKYCEDGSIDCEKQLFGSYLNNKACKCECAREGQLIYTSSIDGMRMCSWDHEAWWPDEGFVYDHILIDNGEVKERVLANVYINLDHVVRPDRLDVYPYQGAIDMEFKYHHNKKDCTFYAPETGWVGFYLKDNKPDTLFIDKLVGFYANDYWICDDSRYFMSGFIVRSDSALDWHIGLYDIYKAEDPIDLLFDVHNGVAVPDTILHISMPKIGSKL